VVTLSAWSWWARRDGPYAGGKAQVAILVSSSSLLVRRRASYCQVGEGFGGGSDHRPRVNITVSYGPPVAVHQSGAVVDIKAKRASVVVAAASVVTPISRS
jgi:hypothetical protein